MSQNGIKYMMSSQDLAAFNHATTLASTQPLEAYNQLTALAGRNPADGNLLSWLIFTAPDYATKERWANQARQQAPGDATVQQALSWFASQPKPASPPPPPMFQQQTLPPPPPSPQFQQQPMMSPPPHQQQQFGYAPGPMPPGQSVVIVQQGLSFSIGQKNWIAPILAGLVLVVSGFLPWAQSGRQTLAGTETDGGIAAIVMGVIILIVGFAGLFQKRQNTVGRILAALFFLFMAAVVYFVAGYMYRKIEQETFYLIKVAGGWYLFCFGGLFNFVMGVIFILTAKNK
jgi:hypothetical protein